MLLVEADDEESELPDVEPFDPESFDEESDELDEESEEDELDEESEEEDALFELPFLA